MHPTTSTKPARQYKQLSDGERREIAYLRMRRFSPSQIARELGRHRSTISREIRRNLCVHDGKYRASRAGEKTRNRRRLSHRGRQHGEAVYRRVEELLREDYSPEQVSGTLRRRREASISHETIYKHVWQTMRNGGDLHLHLRQARKQRRKRYRSKDSRGRVAGKRTIDQRPAAVDRRIEDGHWEIDTVMGSTKACILTLVERRSGYLMIGKLADRTSSQTNLATLRLLRRHPDQVTSITSDNGCEFHGYRKVEEKTGVVYYFAQPHHSWERGTNENANGLIRQYLPKGMSLESLTQKQCDRIARKLNRRPRKRHNYYSPEEIFFEGPSVALGP